MRDIARIHAAGIKVWGSFIFGFDNDALDVFRETLDFIEKSRMEFAQFSLLTPLPGTALFHQFEEEQRIVQRDWSKYDLGSIVFNHPLLTAERLHFEKNHAWRRFYSVRSIIKRLGMPKNRGDLILWDCQPGREWRSQIPLGQRLLDLERERLRQGGAASPHFASSSSQGRRDRTTGEACLPSALRARGSPKRAKPVLFLETRLALWGNLANNPYFFLLVGIVLARGVGRRLEREVSLRAAEIRAHVPSGNW